MKDFIDGEQNLFRTKAKRLAEFCASNHFLGYEILINMKVGELASYYDGIGPEWTPSVVAKIVKHIDYDFEPAAFLLDAQYHACKDRSDERFHECNRQFLENCFKCIRNKYSFWHFIRRHRLFNSAKVLYNACEESGYDSWKCKGRFSK